MFITELQIRVRYAETDQMGIVYHSNYFLYFESARAESIRNLGITYAEMEKSGVMMLVVDAYCRYLRPAKYDDLITVKTILKELPVHHKIEFHHEIFNEKKELLVGGKIILNFIDSTTMKKTTMPVQLKEKLQSHFS